MAPFSSTRLIKGQKAPDFTARDMSGKKITLSKINNRYILLVFMRYSGCPWCNLAIHRLCLEYPTLKKHDCRVITFIQSHQANINNNIYKRHTVKPKYSIIADRERKFYKLYNVSTSLTKAVRSITNIPDWVHAVKKHGFKQGEIDGKLFLVPAAFVIDGRTQKIISSIYGRSFYDTRTFVDIYKEIFFKQL